MRPTRIGALTGAFLAALLLLPFAPILFTYIGAALAYRAGAIGEWARMPAAIGGFLFLLAVPIAILGAVGALVGFLWMKAGPK